MCLGKRDAPTGVRYIHYFAVEKGACLVRSQVSHVALERMKM
jgi:hypothetical protein